MWFVYMLLCEDGSLYTGYSNNVDQRFSDHQNGKGGHYTTSRKPVKIIYSEQLPTQSEALKREAQIKSWSRKKKIKFLGLEYYLQERSAQIKIASQKGFISLLISLIIFTALVFLGIAYYSKILTSLTPQLDSSQVQTPNSPNQPSGIPLGPSSKTFYDQIRQNANKLATSSAPLDENY